MSHAPEPRPSDAYFTLSFLSSFNRLIIIDCFTSKSHPSHFEHQNVTRPKRPRPSPRATTPLPYSDHAPPRQRPFKNDLPSLHSLHALVSLAGVKMTSTISAGFRGARLDPVVAPWAKTHEEPVLGAPARLLAVLGDPGCVDQLRTSAADIERGATTCFVRLRD